MYLRVAWSLLATTLPVFLGEGVLGVLILVRTPQWAVFHFRIIVFFHFSVMFFVRVNL